MKFLDNLIKIGEQEMFLRTRRMIRRAETSVNLLDKVIGGSGDVSRIAEIKEESYLDLLDISKSITSGAIAPNLITDMLSLISLENDIVDTIFNVARSLVRFKVSDSQSKKFMTNSLKEASALMHSALGILYRLHGTSDFSEMRKYQQEISRIEEEGDEVKERMLSYAYNSRTDFKTFYHLINLAYLSDNVLDACEDIADMYVSIMLSIAT
jgi:uncharacterized protein Yka (UPF0111/DUF47 family)